MFLGLMGDDKKHGARVGRNSEELLHAAAVQVQCEGFRCLAYRDHEGRWIDFHTGKPLVGTVTVVPPEAL
jgi:hypothetical protein